MKKIFSLIYDILIRHKYLHFFLTGTSGVAINLAITWYFTTYVFGLSNYFKAYMIGLAFNLIYNFSLHTFVTFNTKTHHIRRLLLFIGYSLLLTPVNFLVVRTVTEFVGHRFYLIVIAGTIFVFSSITFLLFKFSLFKEES